MTGISAIGIHLPRLRLARSSIAAATGWLTPGSGAAGHRTLGFWDEDAVTMAVAAARACLDTVDFPREAVASLVFASTTPPFAERQNASIVHRALQLEATARAQDVASTPRAAMIALHEALERPDATLIAAGDRPVSAAGSAGEMRFSDGGGAVLVNGGAPILDYLGGASITSALVDRYRATGEYFATGWEERWIREEGFLGIVPEAIHGALAQAGLAPGDVDWLVMPCTIPGVGRALTKQCGLTKSRIADTLAEQCGDTGSGHALVMLAHTLEAIEPGDKVLIAQFGQGATALLFEATGLVAGMPQMAKQALAGGIIEENYLKLPVWSGLLPWEMGLRGRTGVNEALSVAHRHQDALLGFVGGRCRVSGAVQFPASRMSVSSQAPLVDTQEPYPLADRGGRVATHTIDSLAFSRSPPSCYGLVDIDGGGRLMMEFTDPDAATLSAGSEVRFVFRIKDIDERTGFRRYFWKAVGRQGAAVSRAEA